MHSFDIHAPKGANKKKRILGRGQGSGRGTTAGKGNKGQQSRSGGKTYLGFEGGQMPLYRRLAHRGFSNYPFKVTAEPVNLDVIEKKYADGETVDPASLVAKHIANKGDVVKILANGEISKKITVKDVKISAAAKEKVIQAGGTVVDFVKKERPPKANKKKGEKKVDG
ncbi:MAG: 50S ribosomal protein L15 [Spirochaetaceae bacterium]|jgi:large subunit ribosomal protein L15|nr:50S ribosomal protein L15 [Spirochaetaceae bacterium]